MGLVLPVSSFIEPSFNVPDSESANACAQVLHTARCLYSPRGLQGAPRHDRGSPAVTSSDAIQLAVAIVLAVTLVAVLWYAWEARKQAKATWRIATASMRPVLEQWIERTPITAPKLVVRYRNFGNGPAVQIVWRLEPGHQTHKRVGMGTQDVQGVVEFDLAGSPSTLIAEYSDANGSQWQSRLELTTRDGFMENGSSAHSPL